MKRRFVVAPAPIKCGTQHRSVLLRLLGIVFASVFAAISSAPTLSAQDTSLVVVSKDRIEITMIPPKLRIRQTRSAQVGFYSWRFDLKTADGLSIVLASDTVMRTDNIRDVVRGSTLRRCVDGKDFSSLRCRTVMPDSVSVRGEVLRIVLRDSAIVAMVRKERPLTMWGSTFEPNGRFRVDRLSVEFDDEDEGGWTYAELSGWVLERARVARQ